MMRRNGRTSWWTAALLVTAGSVLVSCGGPSPDGPPVVVVGDDVCASCNMIISDERFACASVAETDRGSVPRLFDDLNCQIAYERAHPDERFGHRWVHDYAGGGWITAEDATYVRSGALRTPMASGTAAFASPDDARALLDSLGEGEIIRDSERGP